MKQPYLSFVQAFIVAVGVLFLSNCNGSKLDPDLVDSISGKVSVEKITIDQEDFEMTEGESTVLTATVLPDDATDQTVSWNSSKEDVVMISNTGKTMAMAPGKSVITAKAGSKTDFITITVIAKEDPVSPSDPSGNFMGSYALDDGSGLTDTYFSFFKGTLSKYSLKQSGTKVVIAENSLWNTSVDDFSMDDTGEYAIENGTMYLKGVPYGTVSFSGNKMTLSGKEYTRFTGFKPERYSVITVGGGSRITCDHAAQTLTIPVTLKTIPSGKLTVTSDASWAVPGEWKDGLLTLQVQECFDFIVRTAMLTLSYPQAVDVTLSLVQSIVADAKTDPTAANCYVISASGTHQIKAVYGNTTAAVKNIASVEVLWESFGTSTTPSKGDIIQSVSYSPGSGSSAGAITLSTPSTLKNGNAVVAAKDASGNILWSWHIWVCKDYDPAATAQAYYNNAGVMMDRNLGATSATPGDVGALGLLYQWGRKDPFLGGCQILYLYSSDRNQEKAASTLSWPSTVSSDSSNGTIAYATAHPTTFITYNSSNHDWYYTGSSSTDNTRWQSSKTVYDPCPPGWRVPDGGDNGIWSKAVGSNSPSRTYDSTNRGMNFSGKFGSTSTIWYPASGSLNYYDGSLYNVGISGDWWSCTPYDGGGSAYCLFLDCDGLVFPSDNYYRPCGRSVRCLQE